MRHSGAEFHAAMQTRKGARLGFQRNGARRTNDTFEL
jgi:hypothetical protein